jgi:hypothetical protein
METNLLEKVIENKEMSSVLMRCCYSGKILSVPQEIYRQVEGKDKSVADTEFAGFYVSPGFCFYKSPADFRMFCED